MEDRYGSVLTQSCYKSRKSFVTARGVLPILRLRAHGYLVVYTPYARLYHHESRSRWYQPPRAEEVQYMLDRWGALLACDPYYNPHLTLEREDFSFDRDRARTLLRDE